MRGMMVHITMTPIPVEYFKLVAHAQLLVETMVIIVTKTLIVAVVLVTQAFMSVNHNEIDND